MLLRFFAAFSAPFATLSTLQYNYLFSYFLPDLSDPCFRQDAAQEIEQDERMTYCRYMAAWLPHEPYYHEILKQIAGAAQRANDKEDAVEHPLFCYLCDLSWGGCIYTEALSIS